MSTMVNFHASGAAYCIPVHATRAVRDAAGMVTLPDARPDIAGILPGAPPLTVLSPFGPLGANVVVVEAAGKTFGILVEAVSGLRRVNDDDIQRPPHGQNKPLISGTVDINGELTLIADPTVLAERL